MNQRLDSRTVQTLSLTWNNNSERTGGWQNKRGSRWFPSNRVYIHLWIRWKNATLKTDIFLWSYTYITTKTTPNMKSLWRSRNWSSSVYTWWVYGISSKILYLHTIYLHQILSHRVIYSLRYFWTPWHTGILSFNTMKHLSLMVCSTSIAIVAHSIKILYLQSIMVRL